MISLPQSFLARPIAHRGLHDRAAGRIENSHAAIEAAVAAGYGIEIDVQPSADGVAMVFHDYDLRRLIGAEGFVREKTAKELGAMRLLGGTAAVPRLRDALEIIDGRVPLLIEIKDQDGQLGPAVGALEAAIARDIRGYEGDVALMSFNPNTVRVLGEHCPDRARGLVTDPFEKKDWPLVPAARRARLARISDFDAAGASFVSHNRGFLTALPLRALRAQNTPVLCWTVRSEAEAARAYEFADQITFEGFLP